VSEVSGVTIVFSVAWADVAEVLACAGFFEAHPAANIPASNNVNGVSHFMATVNRVALHGSIHLLAKTKLQSAQTRLADVSRLINCSIRYNGF
jgi:hypothetical protein